jgi:hypothetical protein
MLTKALPALPPQLGDDGSATIIFVSKRITSLFSLWGWLFLNWNIKNKLNEASKNFDKSR